VTAGFFHLEGVEIAHQPCQGTACFVARHRDPARWREAEHAPARISCVGRCFIAPARAGDPAAPRASVDAPVAVVLEGVAAGGRRDYGVAVAAGAYTALEAARSAGPDAVLDAVDASRLRGRGGAGFPAGRKWRTARSAPGERKYVVANADEGDAGAYVDRFLLEDDPHRVLEGIAIAALAIGASDAFVYVRKEYPEALGVVRRAVEEASAAGALGDLAITVVEGEGSYVCGEETALLNALEGRRPDVRARPPYTAVSGLFGAPTVVSNVETLAAIPWIVAHGGDAYAAFGAGDSRGTKVLSLNSLFRRPGLYEVELGLPVRAVVERLGGGVDGELRGVLIGGPLAGVLPPALLDTPLTFEDLRAVGCELGHGGVVAFDDRTSIAQLARHVLGFAAYESCGKCTPCREGTARLEALLAAARPGQHHADRREKVAAAVEALRSSLCGHGTGTGAFLRSIAAAYPQEYDRCLA
jgi:NADH:ubiquinone oxidoreductase subunit F (NADH-binding)